MKFLLFGMTVSLSILGTAASGSASGSAARALSRAAVPIAAPYDWSGFYIGGNGGWGTGNSCSTFTNGAWDNQLLLYNPKFNGCHDATGGTAGGQIGYRWQSSSWVLGLEAQGNWAGFQGDNRAAAIIPADLINTSRTDSFGRFTGQIGYAWNNLLVTVKGGGESPTTPTQPLSRALHSMKRPTPAGVPLSASALITALRQTGRWASITIICSWAVGPICSLQRDWLSIQSAS